MSALAHLREKAHGRPLAVACLAILSLLLGVVLPIQAQAAVNEGIEVSDLALVKSDRSGNDSSGYLSTQDLAKLTYRWDATKTTVSAGDSFAINVGTLFKNLQHPITVPLEVNDNGALTEVGTCSLGEKTIDCTFSAKVDELKAAGFNQFKGSGQALLLITQATTAEEAEMTVNGAKAVKVDLPGTGGIRAPAPATYRAQTFSKVGQVITSASSSMIWEINFGSDYIKERLAASGQSITMDGSTRQTIVITDTLGPGMAFTTDKSRMFFGLRNSAAEPSIGGVFLTDAAGKDLNGTYGDFDLSVETEGQEATITITGPFAEQSNYRATYPVTFTSQNGKATVGVQYRNSAALSGSDAKAEFTRSYAESFKVNVDMAPGFGGFEVLKTLGGPALDAVDVASTTLPVSVDYTLPAAASTYPDWTAPGTLNADGMSGTVELNASIGKTNTFPGTFPKGTVLTLSEDVTKASPAPDGYSWGVPAFTVGRVATNTLTIGDRTSIRVTLDNTAEAAAPVPSGTFQVSKTVTGTTEADGAAAKDYSFAYTCSDGQSGTVIAKGDGTPVQADKTFPEGTTCTLTEDAASAQIKGYTLSTPGEQTVTIKAAGDGQEVATAAFTNAYFPDEGTFSIVKTVQGGPADAATATYTFTYTCDNGLKGSLQVRGDGTRAFSRFIPAGATCTLAEDLDAAARDGYQLDASLSQDTVAIVKSRDQLVNVTNTYTPLTGTFSVAKTVSGDYTPAQGETVKVAYTCDDADATTGELQVPTDGSAVTSPALPAGATCTLSEDAASAAREGYSVATTYSSPTVTITKDQSPEVTVTNHYTRLTGGFSITKTVEGDGAALAPQEFTFEYTCTDKATGVASSPVEVTVAAGSTKEITDVPTGSCTVTEKNAEVGGATLSTSLTVDGKDAGAQATVEVTGAAGQASAVAAVNTYTLKRGTFSVTKEVEGTDAGEADFSFSYTCTDGTTGELTAKADGKAVTGRQVPTGTQCTITEDAESAKREGLELKAPAPQTVTIAQADEVVATTFVNAYTATPPAPQPSPSATASPKPEPEPSASQAPSAEPSASPSADASAAPSASATATDAAPPVDPSAGPSADPSASAGPSADPSASAGPSADPSASADPTAGPSAAPGASADPPPRKPHPTNLTFQPPESRFPNGLPDTRLTAYLQRVRLGGIFFAGRLIKRLTVRPS